ncbi:hypothetical protein AAG570_005255 [Ranatra chinensis]|uniref:Uncharacterized protein n=1 Tax=Ranatra chinensis TaxID=642074 RepID=A0ABD0Y079_9HEMI
MKVSMSDRRKKSLENDMDEVDWDVAERPQEKNSYHSHHRPLWWEAIVSNRVPVPFDLGKYWRMSHGKTTLNKPYAFLQNFKPYKNPIIYAPISQPKTIYDIKTIPMRTAEKTIVHANKGSNLPNCVEFVAAVHPTTTAKMIEETTVACGTSNQVTILNHNNEEKTTTVPSSTVPSSTVPSSTVPSSTVPSSTVPSSTVPSPIVPDARIFLYLSDKSLEEFCTCRNKESTTPTTQPGLMKESTCSATRSGQPNKGLIHLIEATRPPQKLFPRVNVSTTQGPACPHSPHPSQPPIQQHQVPTPTQSAHPTTATLHPNMIIVEHRQLVTCPYCGNDISMVFVPLSDNGPTTEHVYQSAPMGRYLAVYPLQRYNLSGEPLARVTGIRYDPDARAEYLDLINFWMRDRNSLVAVEEGTGRVVGVLVGRIIRKLNRTRTMSRVSGTSKSVCNTIRSVAMGGPLAAKIRSKVKLFRNLKLPRSGGSGRHIGTPSTTPSPTSVLCRRFPLYRLELLVFFTRSPGDRVPVVPEWGTSVYPLPAGDRMELLLTEEKKLSTCTEKRGQILQWLLCLTIKVLCSNQQHPDTRVAGASGSNSGGSGCVPGRRLEVEYQLIASLLTRARLAVIKRALHWIHRGGD